MKRQWVGGFGFRWHWGSVLRRPAGALQFYSLIVLVAFSPLAACARNFGVADEQLIAVEPEDFFIPAPARAVWREAEGLASGRASGTLTCSPEDGILTWREELGECAAPGTLESAEIAEVGPGGCAVTSLYVKSVEGGTRIRIQRMYFGPRTGAYLSASRGGMEREFCDEIRRRLGVLAKGR